jgi:hypothetical protein
MDETSAKPVEEIRNADQGRPLMIFLVEDDPVDATWLTELIK